MSKIGRETGQVVVEMLLILPIFLTIVFTIMEMGFISFHMILLNHATYEVARIGAMTQVRSSGSMYPDCGRLSGLMSSIILSASVTCRTEQTGTDAQAGVPTWDLIATGTDQIKLIFPFSQWMLSDTWGSGQRTLVAQVRMPIEQPFKY